MEDGRAAVLRSVSPHPDVEQTLIEGTGGRLLSRRGLQLGLTERPTASWIGKMGAG